MPATPPPLPAKMHANESRLARYLTAAEAWERAWPGVVGKIASLRLADAHREVAAAAADVLPHTVSGE